MTKTEQIRKMIELNNGYLFTSEIETAGISRTYLAKFVKENNMERVAKGICPSRAGKVLIHYFLPYIMKSLRMLLSAVALGRFG